MGLPPAGPSQLNLLARFDRDRVVDDRLAWEIRDLLDLRGEVTPEVVRIAVETDLGRLAADARERHPQVARAGGHAVLLLGAEGEDSSPRTLPDFRRLLATRITQVRGWMGLPPAGPSQLNLLVMLHPFRKEPAGIADVPWVFNRTLAPALWDGYVKALRLTLKGWPSAFTGDLFTVLLWAQVGGFVQRADDWDLIKRFREELRQP